MSTAGTPIKFRCSNCDKHLGVSRSKAGMAVACPRCGTELVVPEPPPETVAVAEPAEADPAQLFRNLVESKPAPAPAPAPPPPPPPVPEPAAPRRPEPVAEPAPAPFLGLNLDPAPTAAPPPPPPPIRTEPAPRPAPAAPPQPAPAPAFPLIQTDAPVAIRAAPEPIRAEAPARVVAPALSDRGNTPRRSDVVLPRTAVVLWSFSMLIFVVLAFAVGLLLGHFVWVKG